MRPLLIFDSDCAVCVRQVENLKFYLGPIFSAESFREVGFFERHAALSRDACEKAIQYVDGRGRVFAGAEAVARLFSLKRRYRVLTWIYYVPGLRRMWDNFYRAIAKNRYALSERLTARKTR